MSLFLLPRSFHVNSAGLPYALAKLYHYRAGTLTTLSVYTDETFTTPHANPILADANGLFPAVYVNPNSGFSLRVILQTSAGVQLYDEDNIIINAAGLGDLTPFTDAAKNLGSSVKRWNDLWLSGLIKIKSSTFKSSISTTTLTADRAFILPDADFQCGVSQINTQDADYTFLISDAGKTLYHTSASNHTYTIPANASVPLPIGTVVEVENSGTGTVTLVGAGGVGLYRANSAGAVTIVIQPYQNTRIKKVTANTWLAYDKASIVPGTFVGTITGCTTSPIQTFAYSIVGDKVSLTVTGALTATSNTTAMTITGVPAAIQPLSARNVPCIVTDNTADRVGAISISGGTMTFFNSSGTGALSSSGFTNSGTKGIGATFNVVYQI